MSVTQTYYLAHTARGKLSSEAARSDHNLRLLVGHANLLDSLMLELAEAEQEQESWFNQSVRGAEKKEKHIQWAEATIEEPEEDWQAEDADSDCSDSDDDFEDEDMQMADFVPLQRVQSRTQVVEEEVEDDGEEDYESLTLTLSPSHSASPPELSHDSEEDDSSEDESMPPSPPTTSLPSFSEKQREQIATTSFYNQGFYIPQRQAPTLPSSVSVY